MPQIGQWLTPRFPLTGWPDWLVALIHLLALTRRTWVYTVLLSKRNPSAGWLDRFLQHCSTLPNDQRNRQALLQSVRELEQLANELESVGFAVQAGGRSSRIERLLAELPKDSTGPYDHAAWQELAHALLQKSSADWNDSTPALRAALNALSGYFNVRELPDALREFCQEIDTFKGWRTALWGWDAHVPRELKGEENWTTILAYVRKVQHATTLSETVLEVDDLVECLFAPFDEDDPQFALIACLVEKKSWDDMVRLVRPWMPPPSTLDNHLLFNARQRLMVWKERAEALVVSPPPHTQPPGPVPENYWLFVEIPPSLWKKPADAIERAIACIDDWRDPSARPNDWRALGRTPEEEALRAVLASLYMDDVIACFKPCYREHRNKP